MDVFKTKMILEKFIIINFFWDKQNQKKNLFGKKASKKNLLVHKQQ